MNIEQNLIPIKNEDKTEEVIYCKRSNKTCDITFKNNKTYTYSNYNVVWSTKLIEIDTQAIIVYENKVPISGIIKIIKFQEHNYIRLIFKTRYHKLYHVSELTIEKNALENSTSKDCFTYLKELASNIDFENDNDSISKQFEAMTAISPTNVLADYLNPKTVRHFKNNKQIIFPFGFNISQKEATELADK